MIRFGDITENLLRFRQMSLSLAQQYETKWLGLTITKQRLALGLRALPEEGVRGS